MKPLIVGIDPGLSGGIAFIFSDSKIHTFITPTIQGKGSKREYNVPEMAKFFENWEMDGETKLHVFLERQSARPGQGVVSMFSIGKGYGIWLGILGALRISHEIVQPATWSTVMLAGVPRLDTKAAAAIVVSRLFPKHNFKASERCKKGHEGMIDAILIAEFGRRKLGSQSLER